MHQPLLIYIYIYINMYLYCIYIYMYMDYIYIYIHIGPPNKKGRCCWLFFAQVWRVSTSFSLGGWLSFCFRQFLLGSDGLKHPLVRWAWDIWHPVPLIRQLSLHPGPPDWEGQLAPEVDVAKKRHMDKGLHWIRAGMDEPPKHICQLLRR